MRLAIVHYHLGKGGVTRVIANALAALGDSVEKVVVLSSTEAEEDLKARVEVVPELAYCREASRERACALHAALGKAARRALGGPPDIWHIHNHSLGKNVNFPAAMHRLLSDGARFLLQIHDFAEDGRPGNYAAQWKPYAEGVFQEYDRQLYPKAPQVAYAVLNGWNERILEQAGLDKDTLFWLPNAVTASLPDADPAPVTGKPLFLYPTRAIRRKNVGELLLLARTFPDFRFATTLSPKNPEWAPVYEGWKDLVRELSLPVDLALGERAGMTFPGLVQAAKAMVTTSVGEGFGLAFLEPWLFGKPLCGRDLPAVTDDFRHNGIALPDLYREWPVDCRSFAADSFHQRYRRKLGEVYRMYGRSLRDADVDAAWEAMTRGGRIDFGKLDETAQAEHLRSGEKTDPQNAPLDPARLDHSVIRDNAEAIRSTYGLPSYGKQLMAVYNRLLGTVPEEPGALESSRILDAFLDPGGFRFLRS